MIRAAVSDKTNFHVESDLLQPALERIDRTGKIQFQQDKSIILCIQ
jgi:hypothetical protein